MAGLYSDDEGDHPPIVNFLRKLMTPPAPQPTSENPVRNYPATQSYTHTTEPPTSSEVDQILLRQKQSDDSMRY